MTVNDAGVADGTLSAPGAGAATAPGAGAATAPGAGADPLAPVRAHLLRGAREEADRITAEARAHAAAVLGQARHDAEEAGRQARARGRAEAAPLAAAERRRGRERARSIVLGAQRQAHQELRARVLAAAVGLRDEPGYEQLLARLTAMATQAAGPGSRITADPAGGVVARSAQAVVDCSLPRLAALAVDALGDRTGELWTP
jgi:cell division septum initiation protein DivIVA